MFDYIVDGTLPKAVPPKPSLCLDKSTGKAYYSDAASGSWKLVVTGDTGAVWGNITGTLSGQTDLQTALNAKTNAAVVPNTAPSAGQLPVGNAGGTAYAPASISGDATLASTGALTIANGAVTEAKLTLADNTTDNVSITAHGFAPKAPNDATQFLNGTGAYSVPAGGGGGLSGTITTFVFGGGASQAFTGTTARADCTGGSFTLVLPASPAAGVIVNVKKVDATVNTATVDGNAHNIDGDATKVLSGQYQSLQLQYDATSTTWNVI